MQIFAFALSFRIGQFCRRGVFHAETAHPCTLCQFHSISAAISFNFIQFSLLDLQYLHFSIFNVVEFVICLCLWIHLLCNVSVYTSFPLPLHLTNPTIPNQTLLWHHRFCLAKACASWHLI